MRLRETTRRTSYSPYIYPKRAGRSPSPRRARGAGATPVSTKPVPLSLNGATGYKYMARCIVAGAYAHGPDHWMIGKLDHLGTTRVPFPEFLSTKMLLKSTPDMISGADTYIWMMDEDWQFRHEASHIFCMQARTAPANRTAPTAKQIYFSKSVIKRPFILALMDCREGGEGQIKPMHCANCADTIMLKFQQSQAVWEEWTKSGVRVEEPEEYKSYDSMDDLIRSLGVSSGSNG